jgi:Na+-transporting methylmalonyl-CoA/oxaloacetate decarboxylase gamma subunit
MTVLGKVMVFFVLVLSLVWTWLTMNAFVTRTNWKTQYDAAAKELQAANAALDAQAKYYEGQRQAADVTAGQQREEIGRLRQQVAALTKDKDDATAKLTAKLAAEQEADAPTRALQNEKVKLQNQVDLLQAETTKSEQRVNESLIARQKALDDKLQAEIDRDAARRRADQLATVIDRQNDRSGGPGSGTPAVDEGFRATVLSVAGNGEEVEISLGANADLKKGAVLQVYRNKPEPKYVGQLQVTRVEPYSAVGRFIPRAGVRRPTGDDLPRKDDTVAGAIR